MKLATTGLLAVLAARFRPAGRPTRGRRSSSRSTPVTVRVCRDGPLLLRGPFELTDEDGGPVDPGRATVALCRCGRSRVAPFCDGAHKAGGPAVRCDRKRPRR